MTQLQSDCAPVNKTESTRCYENWGIHEMIYCMKIIAVLLDSTLAMLGLSGKLHIVSEEVFQKQCFRRGTCKRSRTLLRVASTALHHFNHSHFSDCYLYKSFLF